MSQEIQDWVLALLVPVAVLQNYQLSPSCHQSVLAAKSVFFWVPLVWPNNELKDTSYRCTGTHQQWFDLWSFLVFGIFLTNWTPLPRQHSQSWSACVPAAFDHGSPYLVQISGASFIKLCLGSLLKVQLHSVSMSMQRSSQMFLHINQLPPAITCMRLPVHSLCGF